MPNWNGWFPDDVGYGFGPADHGLLAWSYDPGDAGSSSLPAAGVLQVVRLKNRVAGSISAVCLNIANAGVTLTVGQCFAAAFQRGALLGVTVDQASNWQSTGNMVMPINGGVPVPVVADDISVAWYANGSTIPGFSRQASFAALVNFNLPVALSRYATANTGLTNVMPSTLGALSAAAPNFWAGVK